MRTGNVVLDSYVRNRFNMSKKRTVASPSSPISKKAKPSPNFFQLHFETDLDEAVAEKVRAKSDVQRTFVKTQLLPESSVTLTSHAVDIHCTDPTKILDFSDFGISPKILQSFRNANNGDETEEQKNIFQIIGRYMDFCRISNSHTHLPLLALHTVNHINHTRNNIIANNTRIEKLTKSDSLTEDVIESCRDQGLARPKVLFLTPMRKYAYDFVNSLCDIVFDNDKRTILNQNRFEEEFGNDGGVPNAKKKEDYRELMSGNIDDCFRLGIQFAKKALKLYQKFNESDVLICSPLGLRMIVGEEGESSSETDFLASIEVLIVDRANILLMQNWEHVQRIFDVVNGVPSKLDTDISRVKHWALKNYGKIYRQTLIFSEFNFTELHILHTQACENYAGGVLGIKHPESLVENIEKPLIQEFHRFDCDQAKLQSDLRFEYFVNHILPSLEHGTMIFVSSYFDFVRLRNHMKRENESFVQLNEYGKDKRIARARGMFYRRRKKLIIMTERFYYFKRYLIKGVNSIIFYQLPVNPTFYHELINDSSPEGRLESKVVFTKFDLIRMQNIFDSGQAKELIKSDKKFHVLMSD